MRQKGTVAPHKSNFRFMRCESPHKHARHVYAGKITGFESVYAAGPLCGVTLPMQFIVNDCYMYTCILIMKSGSLV